MASWASAPAGHCSGCGQGQSSARVRRLGAEGRAAGGTVTCRTSWPPPHGSLPATPCRRRPPAAGAPPAVGCTPRAAAPGPLPSPSLRLTSAPTAPCARDARPSPHSPHCRRRARSSSARLEFKSNAHLPLCHRDGRAGLSPPRSPPPALLIGQEASAALSKVASLLLARLCGCGGLGRWGLGQRTNRQLDFNSREVMDAGSSQ